MPCKFIPALPRDKSEPTALGTKSFGFAVSVTPGIAASQLLGVGVQRENPNPLAPAGHEQGLITLESGGGLHYNAVDARGESVAQPGWRMFANTGRNRL